jgi:putative redox protein
MEANIQWKNDMAFEATLDGFNFMIDADDEFGGQGLGPKPKGLTLVSLAGCTAMDVISILKKKRVVVDSFRVSTEAVLTDEHPKKFQEILIKYIFKGQDIPLEKVERAISLSLEKYCGVSATLKSSVQISYQILINDNLVKG